MHGMGICCVHISSVWACGMGISLLMWNGDHTGETMDTCSAGMGTIPGISAQPGCMEWGPYNSSAWVRPWIPPQPRCMEREPYLPYQPSLGAWKRSGLWDRPSTTDLSSQLADAAEQNTGNYREASRGSAGISSAVQVGWHSKGSLQSYSTMPVLQYRS